MKRLKTIGAVLFSIMVFAVISTSKVFANFGGLDAARSNLTGVSIASKVLFAGGMTGPSGGYNFSDLVDIYDTETAVKSTAHLPSGGRARIKAASVSNKVIFYGGEAGPSNSPADAVDIYNTTTNSWSYQYRQPRSGHAATVIGNKAYFAGGMTSGYALLNSIDIFDAITNSWSTSSLSQPRKNLAATAVCNKAIFAGGENYDAGSGYKSNIVDIYDATTNSWSTTILSQARSQLAAVTVGNRAYFIGGWKVGGALSDRMDIYDCASDSWATTTMPLPDADLQVAVVGEKIYQYGRARYNPQVYPYWSPIVDIFDTVTGNWSTTYLSNGRIDLAVASAGNKIYFAGGYGWPGSCCTTGLVYTVDTIIVPLNSNPIANAGMDLFVDENNGTVFDGSGSTDPNGVNDIVSYAWDFGDGYTASGQTVNHTYADNGIYTATLTVTDTQGAFDTDTATITVNNIAPTASFSITPQTIIRGDSATASFSNPFDPSSVDAVAGFTYSFDCTNDGIFELADSLSTSFTCSYPTAGLYAARGRITDKDGGYSEYLVSINVQTPAEAVNDLINLVQTYNLQQGISNSLDAKLDAAHSALDDLNQNNDQAAINSLQAFISAVEAQRGNQITNAQADTLIAATQAIINSL